MAHIPKFHTHIKDGKVQPFDPGTKNRFGLYLTLLEGKKVEVVVKEYKAQRSSEQNSYYHGVVVKLLSDHTGYTSDEMHEALKWLFLKKPGEHGLPDTCGSTAKLNTKQFEDYISQIKRWAAEEFKIYIPEPNAVEYDHY